MSEQVTFGVEVANTLIDLGVRVMDGVGNGIRRWVHPSWHLAPYHLPEGTALTSEQVTAAVQADLGKLAAKSRCNIYSWNGDEWLFWDRYSDGWSSHSYASPDKPGGGPWELVYRPDLKAEPDPDEGYQGHVGLPEEPPRPAQGTSLREILEEWCEENGKTGFVPGQVHPCKESGPEEPPRPAQGTTLRAIMWEAVRRFGGEATGIFSRDSFNNAYRDLTHIQDSGNYADSTVAAILSGRNDVERCSAEEDAHWRLLPLINPGEDMATPDPSADVQLPRTTRMLSEAVRHAEAGGVVQSESILLRWRDSRWELRSIQRGDTWSRGSWAIGLGLEYTLYPSDYLDDAPEVEHREGPELWAWMCRTGRSVVDDTGYNLMRVSPDGEVQIQKGIQWGASALLPRMPCIPASGTWD